jgi:YHS domain-containing protein
VGGPIMIVLLALTAGFVMRGPIVARARARVETAAEETADHAVDLERAAWRDKLSLRGLSDAASYSIADIKMLRKELVIGYGVAGFITVLVPMRIWNDLFLQGHGFWTSAENVIVGPVIAFLSFVCSIGNVPMAAALWHGGISFGGVISFVFADLIAFPLVLVYRKYYGTRLTLRLVAWFYGVMVVAGLAVEGLFRLAGGIPKTRSARIVATHFAWNYTTLLNIIFLVVFAAIYWLYRNRERLGGGHAYAIDPVCSMQVEKANAPARIDDGGVEVWFCSDGCRDRYVRRIRGDASRIVSK